MKTNDEEVKLKLLCDCSNYEELIAEEEEPLVVEEKDPVVVGEEKPVVVEEEQVVVDFAKEPEQTPPQQQTKQYVTFNSILQHVSHIFRRFTFFR